MEKNIKFTENKAKGKEVSNEKEGTQDRALGDTRGDRGGLGTEGFELDELSAVCEIGVKPVRVTGKTSMSGKSFRNAGRAHGKD